MQIPWFPPKLYKGSRFYLYISRSAWVTLKFNFTQGGTEIYSNSYAFLNFLNVQAFWKMSVMIQGETALSGFQNPNYSLQLFGAFFCESLMA